jgi:ferrochelatase
VIISPLSFTIDNSETEFELHIEYEEVAQKLGFKEYLVASCPNDDDKFVQVIKNLI